MNISDNLNNLCHSIDNSVKLVAVSKTKSNDQIMEAYEAGQKIFGENKVQELVSKYNSLPKDIEWHMVGHLQKNKVKYIANFIKLIHSVDNFKLLKEINRQAKKNSIRRGTEKKGYARAREASERHGNGKDWSAT